MKKYVSLDNLAYIIQQFGSRMDAMEVSMQELSNAMNELNSQLRPETDVASVKPKEKSDLEIFKQSIDDSVKNNYIDLDEIANGKEL